MSRSPPTRPERSNRERGDRAPRNIRSSGTRRRPAPQKQEQRVDLDDFCHETRLPDRGFQADGRNPIDGMIRQEYPHGCSTGPSVATPSYSGESQPMDLAPLSSYERWPRMGASSGVGHQRTGSGDRTRMRAASTGRRWPQALSVTDPALLPALLVLVESRRIAPNADCESLL
jgi:hypothetical protein